MQLQNLFKMCIRKIFFLSLFLLFLLSYSQEYKFHHYTLEDGLSQETVNTILKDSRGFLWIGTQDGLNRFDGDRFEVFKHEGNSNSISGNHVYKLLEDNMGNIWVGTANDGVSYYNPTHKSFTKIHHPTADMTAACTGITKDKKGDIYISFLNQTLLKVTISDHSIKSIFQIPYFQEHPFTINTIKIINNKLYVGTKEGKTFYSDLSTNKNTFHEIIHNYNWGAINTIAEDLLGNILIGTNSGLWRLNLPAKQFTKLTVTKDNFFSAIVITDIAFRNNTLWVATEDGLYEIINYQDKTTQFNFNVFKGDNNHVHTISSSNVHCLYSDDEYLWIGVNKLDVIEFTAPVFKSFESTNITDPNYPLTNNHVFSIYKEAHRTWIGTRAGLNLVYKDTVYNFTKNNNPHSIASNVIRGIEKDNSNNLWITTTKGISIVNLDTFSPASPVFYSFYHDPKDPNSLSENNTRSIFIDTQKNIWVKTFGGGLNLFTGDLDKKYIAFKHFKSIPDSTGSLSSDRVLSMIQDKNNVYWIGTKNGLNKMYFENTRLNKPIFKNYRHVIGDSTSLSNNSVLSLLEDSDNILWIGTQNGLNRFDPKTDTFKTYNKKEGLLNPVVYEILDDNNENLWLSTNLGLFRFDKTNEVFYNYTPEDGLQSTEFNLGAAFKDEVTGDLYFGGINGLNFFSPENISDLDQEGQLIFTELRIKDKVENPSGNATSVLSENIIQTRKIVLKHDQFPFYLNFSNLDFRAYKNNHYLYKLIPKDKSWNILSDNQEIQFLSLSPGKYKLQVQGKTRNKLWNKKPLELEIEILPPWWKTHAMLVLYGIIALGLIFVIHTFLLRQRLSVQEAQKLRELNEQKSKLYTNITHEFRTPITVILGVLQNLKSQNVSKNGSEDKDFFTIDRNARNMLSLVNQMLDLAKLEKGKLNLHLQQGDIVKFCKYLVESFSSLCQSKNITCTFYNEQEEIYMDFDPEKIQQIVSNLLSNAIKFSPPESKIIIHISRKDTNLTLKVKDSGKGITPDKIPYVFDRFYQVDNTNTRLHEGTGIGLALTKELVVLMQGEILIESIVNKGSTFTITLPVTNTAIIKESTIPEDTSAKSILPSVPSSKNSSLFDSNNNKSLVLIVEDNKDILQLLAATLEKNYRVIMATNGNEGIEKALQRVPDIIVSDVMMPDTDGYELCRTLKNDERTNHIPIILLTAKVTEKDKITGLLHGADAYLIKPFNSNELLVRIEKLITLRAQLHKKYTSQSSWQAIADKNMDEKNTAFITKAIKYIETNLDDSAFGILALADNLHLSESQCYRKIKAITGFSTAIFIRKVRLQKAKFLLQTTGETVSEVSYKTGFNDPGWFSKAFKEEFGVSPNAIRNPMVSA